MQPASFELLAPHPAADIGRHLPDEDPIAYRDNGNRAVFAAAMLARIDPLRPLLGITRVAEISALATYPYPVFQAVRPSLHLHRRVGQNTGAQGKGPTRAQAELSAVMESIEAYCAEPKGPVTLVRGSYESLRMQHVVLDPRRLQHFTHAAPAAPDEPLMWTEAWETKLNAAVLVPAQAVFFPLLPGDYASRTVFPGGTNGLASGATYLEAVVHGLYEVIERHYKHEWEAGRATAERFHLKELIDLHGHVSEASDYGIAVHALRLPGGSDLPVVMCHITDLASDRRYLGVGCCATVDVAVTRAISEAWQAVATTASGAREDIGREKETDAAPALPLERTLRVADYRGTVIDRVFGSLREEYELVVGWLAERGFHSICVANLTRRGVDVPVVKVIVPGLTWSAARRPAPPAGAREATTTDVLRVRHGAFASSGGR